MRRTVHTTIGLSVLCLSLVAAGPEARVAAATWQTGPALEKQLAEPVTLSFSKVPLGRVLQSIREANHVAVVRDRRVDPDQIVELAVKGESLRSALAKIADQLHLGYCQLSGVAYFGPVATARRLRTVAALRLEDARPLPANVSRKFLTLRSSQWDDLAEPRKLIAALAEEAGVELVGAEQIPHDLWAAADLPSLSWIDRMTLLAAQFDLTFEFRQDGSQIELVPMPETVTLARSYQAGKQPVSVARRWAKALPNARVAVHDGKVRVDGSLEDHELVEHRLRGTPTQRATVQLGKEVYQLTVEQTSLTQLLAQLAQRLNLQIEWDTAAVQRAGISPDQLVSVKVQDASLNELLKAVLAGTGLTFRQTGSKIVILPSEKKQP